MPVRALRFLHAANLRLDATLSVSAVVPDDIQTILDEAVPTAFSQIVSAAIEQDADALLLTGNTFDASVGSLSAEVTLRKELSRLNETGLPVFITPGLLDPAAAWKEIPDLPENVTVFHQASDPGAELTDRGRHLATILPVSAHTGVEAPEIERLLATAGASPGERGFIIGLWIPEDAGATESHFFGYSSLDYLAAGAQATNCLPATEGHVRLQHGPQGLHAGETGWQGCQLVDVQSDGELISRLLPVAPVRWETCVLETRGIHDRDELCERMLARIELLTGYANEVVRIVTWPMEQHVLEAVGISSEQELQVLSDTLSGLTDQPKHGLRYVHVIQPTWEEAVFPAAVDKELWQDFLTEIERVSPVDRDRLQKLWEQHSGGTAVPTGWPTELRWPPVNPERIRRLTLQNGRRWFRHSTGGVAR